MVGTTCPSCSAKLERATAKFCSRCGFPLNKKASAPSAAEAPSSQSGVKTEPATTTSPPKPSLSASSSSATSTGLAPTKTSAAVAPQPASPPPAEPKKEPPAAEPAKKALAAPAPPPPAPVREAPYEGLYDALQELNLLPLFNVLRAAGIHDEALPYVEDEDLQQAGLDKPFERRRVLARFQLRSATVGGRGHGTSPSSSSDPTIDNSAKTLVPGQQALSPEALETANADSLRDYARGTLLGRGTFGSVYMAMLDTGRFAAVKEMGLNADDADSVKPQDIITISREITMMRRIKHDNVCEFLGCSWNKKERRLCLFMELVTGGSMTSLVKRFKPLPKNVLRIWTKQLLVGLQFLHSNHIMHRDIKGENVLVDINSKTPIDAAIKLADFGAAKRLGDAVGAGRTVIGTPYWMAPEVVKSNDGYGYSADVWSLGCTVAEMHTGKAPWPAKSNVPAAILMIATSPDGPTDLPTEADGATPGSIDFMKKALTVDPAQRPTCEQLLQHPWILGDMV